MNKSSKDLRQVFLRMNKAGVSAVEIAKVIGKSRQTVHKWRNIDESKLMSDPNPNTQKPSIDLLEFKKYLEANPFAFNRELVDEFGGTIKTMHKWKHRLGFNRKKARTTYKEADDELKKTSNQI
jgi:transposase